MATEFFIPKLGQTVEEVTIVNWLVSDGAKVDFGQEIMEVETDKAVFPVEANGKGYIHIGPFKKGDVVPVLTVVATIGKQDETFKAGTTAGSETEASVAASETAAPAETAPTAPSESAAAASEVFASPRARKLANEKKVDLSRVTPTGYSGQRVVERDVVAYLQSQPKVTPVAQRMADATGVDVRDLTGTGPGGKIVKEDVARTLAGREAPEVQTTAAPAKPISAAPLPDVEVTDTIPLSGVRAIIADRMGTSVHTTARVTLMTEIDATEFVAARTRLKEKVSEEWGYAPGYNDLLGKIVATALRKYPYMNARLTPTCIEHLAHINIGMAVDTERGLLVPVIKDADRKGLRQFGSEFRDMVERARKGRALPDDLTGGTFTITNLGMYGVDSFTPVINLPEAAILGVGRITAKPVVRGTAIEIRQMWTLSLVFDHRIVDGAPAARFLQYISSLVQEPYLLLE